MRWPGRVGAMADFECAVVAESERDPAIRAWCRRSRMTLLSAGSIRMTPCIESIFRRSSRRSAVTRSTITPSGGWGISMPSPYGLRPGASQMAPRWYGYLWRRLPNICTRTRSQRWSRCRGASSRPALVPAVVWSAAHPPGTRTRDASHAPLPGDRGREWLPGVPGNAEPANRAVLRARRVHCHRHCSGGSLPSDHDDAAGPAQIAQLRAQTSLVDRSDRAPP